MSWGEIIAYNERHLFHSSDELEITAFVPSTEHAHGMFFMALSSDVALCVGGEIIIALCSGWQALLMYGILSFQHLINYQQMKRQWTVKMWRRIRSYFKEKQHIC